METHLQKLLDKENKNSSANGTLEEKTKECSKLKQDLDVVKKQAEQTHAAYLKLTDEFAELQNKSESSKKND